VACGARHSRSRKFEQSLENVRVSFISFHDQVFREITKHLEKKTNTKIEKDGMAIASFIWALSLTFTPDLPLTSLLERSLYSTLRMFLRKPLRELGSPF
jgi:hypothetical protein